MTRYSIDTIRQFEARLLKTARGRVKGSLITRAEERLAAIEAYRETLVSAVAELDMVREEIIMGGGDPEVPIHSLHENKYSQGRGYAVLHQYFDAMSALRAAANAS